MASTRRTTRAATRTTIVDDALVDVQRTPERVARPTDDVRRAQIGRAHNLACCFFARVFRARGRSGSDACARASTARSRVRARDVNERLTMDMSRAFRTQVSALLASPFLLFANALSPITPRRSAHRDGALDDAMLALADDDGDGDGDDRAGRAPRVLDGDAHTPDGRRRARGGRQGAHTAPAMGCFNSPSRHAR